MKKMEYDYLVKLARMADRKLITRTELKIKVINYLREMAENDEERAIQEIAQVNVISNPSWAENFIETYK